jgi:uncharacterized membrane protein (DUF4010 family)
MWSELTRYLPPEAIKLSLTLALSFLVGIEREQHKVSASHYALGGIRTFPLIGLMGYAFAVLSHDNPLPVALGFAVVGGLMIFSYRHKLVVDETAGMTTEISALATYLVGALICNDHLWIASALVVVSVLLLELKAGLEALTRRIPPEEILVFAKFLLLAVVILPIVPNQDFGRFALNPFKTWVAVVAVSSVSYGSYVLQKVTRGRGGVLLAAILGGAYSSTITTVVLAKRSRSAKRPHLFAGAILTASGVMYARLAALVAMFNRALLEKLALPFLILAAIGIGGGWAWSHLPDAPGGSDGSPQPNRNPLELRSALLFAGLFVGMLVATQLAIAHLGRRGIFTLAAIFGVADVDPFILGLTQTAGFSTGVQIGAQSILIAAASNNLAKGVYATVLGERKAGREALLLLFFLALLGLVPMFWI